MVVYNVALEEKANAASDPQEKRRWRPTIKLDFHSLLSKLRLPTSLLVGAGITASTTYALVRHVQHEIANAKVTSDPKKWMHEARTKAYDACYYGCNDCGNTKFAFNACAMTAKANVSGVICDGNHMWNWEARYPLECLQVVGEFYKADALKRLKQSYRNQLAVIILTVLAGVLGAVLTYKLWRCIPARPEARAGAILSSDRGWGYQEAIPPAYEYPSTPPKLRGGGRGAGVGAGRLALLMAALVSLFSPSRAYPCTGYDPKADQYFLNANNTLYGVVHGWFSNCYDYTCGCTTTCSGSSGADGTGGGSSCSTTCSTCTASDVTPAQYVNATLSHVQACGFHLADAVDGDVMLRVANPLIERDWRVKISVNSYNLTDVTDPAILCLHDFANH